jgi:Mn2+/Fe2+ NRAMP family transporter
MILGTRRQIMGYFVIGRRLQVFGWIATVMMGLAVVAMFWTL